MDDLPDTVVLHGSRLKWFGFLVISLLFTMAGTFLILDGSGLMAWATAILFGTSSVVFVMLLVRPGRQTPSPEGFEQTIGGRTLAYRWDEVSGFGALDISGNTYVSFSLINDRDKFSAQLSETLVGASHQLGDTFGLKVMDLAALMNAFRARALGLPPSDSLLFL